jgi:tetratricopeptide (TPR) repeat protein
MMTWRTQLLSVLLCAFTSQGELKAQATSDSLAEGRRHLGEGRLTEALVALRFVVATDSLNSVAWNAIGAALNRMELYPEALVASERAVALTPANAGMRFTRALIYSELGRYTAALADLNLSLSMRPDHAPSFTERGAARAALGDLEGAKRDWEQAWRTDSTYIWPRYYRGLWAVSEGDFAGAAADLDFITSANPLPSAQLWRWVAHRRLGREAPMIPTMSGWPAPIAAYLRGQISATQLEESARVDRLPIDDRRLASALFFIAQRHLAEGQRAEARSAFERLVALDVPASPETAAARAALGPP